MGGDAAHNARLFRSVMKGDKSDLANTVILNAGAAVYLSGEAVSVSEGIAKVNSCIRSGEARALLQELCHA